MHRIGSYEPHMSINARTAIPSAVLLFRVVSLHSDVILSRLHQFGYVTPKRRVAVRISTCHLAVYPHLGVLIYSLEIQPEFLAFVILSKIQHLIIYANPCRIISTVIASGSITVDSHPRTPVMGQAYRLLVIKYPAIVNQLLSLYVAPHRQICDKRQQQCNDNNSLVKHNMINNRFRATNIQRIIQIYSIISHLFDYLTYLNI